MLGLGEAGNWPGATKAVSEWFPRRESGWAVALFDSGSSVGAAIAPWLVLSLYAAFGSWRPAFIITGALGFVWMALFLALYRRPEDHPLITDEEREMLLRDKEVDAAEGATGVALPYSTLLRLPQTWGYVLSKTFTDPVWFFVTDWFAIYLVSRGFSVEQGLLAFWVPFIAADAGNFFGGGVSSWLITRGWSVGAARKAIGVIGAVGMTMLVPTIWVDIAAGDHRLLRDLDVRLRRVLDRHPESAGRPVRLGIGGLGERHGRHRRGAGHDCARSTSPAGWPTSTRSRRSWSAPASCPWIALVAMLALVRNTSATRAGIVREV